MKRPSLDFIVAIAVIGILVAAVLLWDGRDVLNNGSSSGSVELSAERGMLIAEYTVPERPDLGKYMVKEVWVEKKESNGDNQLVIRLIGPHVDTEPRVQVVGLDASDDYLHIWSQLGGPPYEVWRAPVPLPKTLTLTRDGKQIILELKHNREAQQVDSSKGG